VLLHIGLVSIYQANTKPIQPDKPNNKSTQQIRYVKLKKPKIAQKKIVKKIEKKRKKRKKRKIDRSKNKTAKTKQTIKEQNNTSSDNGKLTLKLTDKSLNTGLENIDNKTREYLLLYGAEYFSYDDETKKYLKNNLSTIGAITQRYLRYPAISVKTKQSGQNIVQFYLHPNGDISNLKIIGHSQYTTLDKNSYKTIKLAYKDYPTPSQKTKIRIYVKYILW